MARGGGGPATQSVASMTSAAAIRRSLQNREQLRNALGRQKDKLRKLVKEWDEDGDGLISFPEFIRALKTLNIFTTKKDALALFAMVDNDNSGQISYEELLQVLINPAEIKQVKGVASVPWRILNLILDFANLVSVQTVLYLGFVAVFQVLTESLRLKDEYFFDKLVADTFLENHFDSSHNTFETVRRVADIYEWGNQVLWPGIFSASGPHCGHVGSSFGFDSSLDWSPHTTAEALAAKGCNDDVWPDGEGVFHAQGATAWSVAEVVEWMNQLDWSEGISFRQTDRKSVV